MIKNFIFNFYSYDISFIVKFFGTKNSLRTFITLSWFFAGDFSQSFEQTK